MKPIIRLKPRHSILNGGWWVCSGARPGQTIMWFGYGRTPAEAYEAWFNDLIPF